MADVSKLRLNGTSYNIKDDDCRKYVVVVNGTSQSATKVNITTSDNQIELAYQSDVDQNASSISQNATNINKLTELDRYIVFPAMDPSVNPYGNCCAITYGTHAILFDIGRFYCFDEINSTLQSYGIDTIDAIFISHYHGDHDGNPGDEGSYSVWSNAFDMSCCKFYLPLDPPSGITGWESTTEAKLRAQFSSNNFYKPPYGNITINGVSIKAFNNTTADYTYLKGQSVTDYNQYSQMFRAEYLDSSVLFLGDAGKVAQDYQYSQGNFEPTKIISVPHHGLEGDASAGMISVVSPQYAYVSDGYSSNEYMRDPILIAVSRNGGTVLSNSLTYPKGVSGSFGKTCDINGNAGTYTSYAGYGHRTIYFDPSSSMSDFQDGTAERPFSSMRRVISQCKAGNYTTVIMQGDITETTGTIQVTADNGFVEFIGGGHYATNQPLIFTKGAHAIVNSLFNAGRVDITETSFVRLVACGTITTLVVQESILVGSLFSVGSFSWRNSLCACNDNTYLGTGSV